MTWYLDGHRCGSQPDMQSGQQVVGILPAERRGELPDAAKAAGIPAHRAEVAAATRFESHQGYDLISVALPPRADGQEEPNLYLEICMTRTVLLCAGGDDVVAAALKELEARGQKEAPYTPAAVLDRLFSHLTRYDAERMEQIEDEISDMEDALADGTLKDAVGHISRLRRQLLQLKRYYENLQELMEDMLENQNGFLEKQQMRELNLHAARAERMAREVYNLRDYVTQVREAYQNQLDIGMNKTMKLFTTLTAVFLPLTLVTGWYGMNLKMPEYDLPWMYPVVIAGSALVAVAAIWYFTKKKWF